MKGAPGPVSLMCIWLYYVGSKLNNMEAGLNPNGKDVRPTVLREVRPASAQHRRDLARLRRVRDRIDREYAQPLDVEALARGAYMSAGHLSREFRLAYGESPYSYLMTRRIERAMALLRRGEIGRASCRERV